MKLSGLLLQWILVLCLPVLLLSASIAWGFNSLWIYQFGFQKYNVSQETGLASAELEKAGRGMISYFNSADEFVQVTVNLNGKQTSLFTEEEQIHLKDVKQLVWLDYRVFVISMVIVAAYVLTAVFWKNGKHRRWLAKRLIWGCGLSLLIIAVMGVGTLADFDQLFLRFHFLAFANSYWSVTGYMIALFGGLWYDAVLFGIAFMAGLAILIGAAAILVLRNNRKRTVSGGQAGWKK